MQSVLHAPHFAGGEKLVLLCVSSSRARFSFAQLYNFSSLLELPPLTWNAYDTGANTHAHTLTHTLLHTAAQVARLRYLRHGPWISGWTAAGSATQQRSTSLQFFIAMIIAEHRRRH